MPSYPYTCETCQQPSRRKKGQCEQCSPGSTRGHNLQNGPSRPQRQPGSTGITQVNKRCSKSCVWFDEVTEIPEEVLHDKGKITIPFDDESIWLPIVSEAIPFPTALDMKPDLALPFHWARAQGERKRAMKEEATLQDRLPSTCKGGKARDVTECF